MILEQLDIHIQGKKAFNPYLTAYMEIYLKWITYLNVNYKAMKLLGEKHFSPGLGKDFLDQYKAFTGKFKK